MRVLYVDDEPDIREIAEIALGLDPGLDVRLAASGSQALALLEEWQPDAAMIDVMMPGMHGPQLLERMRERENLKAVKVVFVTARAQRSELQNFATLDAVGVIAKPFDPMTLAAQLRELVE